MTLNNETNKEEGMTIVSCMLLNMAHTQGHKYAAEHGPYTRSQVCCWTWPIHKVTLMLHTLLVCKSY